jgi:UDP-glucuronate 4-epimerase
MAIHRFASAIRDGRKLTLYGDGTTSRDYTYIDDVVKGIIAALDSPHQYGIFNLGGGEQLELRQLVSLLEAELGLSVELEYLPEQPGDPPHTRADISRAELELGWRPETPVREGLKHFVRWFLDQPML